MNRHGHLITALEGESPMKPQALTGGGRARGLFARACLCLLTLTAFAGGGATSAVADAPCPNEAIREAQSSTNLPDCRAFEKVTPAYKGSNDMVQGFSPANAWASPVGGRVMYWSTSSFAGASNGFNNYYVSSREGSGWTTRAVAAPEEPGVFNYFPSVVTEDLSEAAVLQIPGTLVPDPSGALVPDPSYPTSFGVGPIGGPYDVVAQAPGPFGNELLGADADLDHIVLRVGGKLYEATEGQLRLLGVRNDGTPFECGVELGNEGEGIPVGKINAISADGSRIFFRSLDPDAQNEDPPCATPKRLYVRENGITTVEVSAPQGMTDPSGPYGVEFAGAPRDGSEVYFRTNERLLPEVVGNETHLYQYSFATHQLTHISGGPDGTGSGQAGIVLPSADGSTLYFTSHSQLVAGEGKDGQPNLYRYDVADGDYRYIATLSSTDEIIVTIGLQPNPGKQLYATPDGKFFVFASERELTPDSPTGGSGVRQLYRYSAASGAIDCLSCPPLGISSQSSAQFTPSIVETIGRYVTPLSTDGSTALFSTADPLVPQDSNGVTDVYEWHEGSQRLISGGTTSAVSFAIGLSADGKDALFSTRESLLRGDRDTWTDFYDARIGGGFVEPTPPARCSDDACQGGDGVAPAAPDVGSSGFAGRGNLSGPHSRKLLLKAISPRQRRLLIQTGRLSLTVKTPGPGLLEARLKAVLDGRNATVDHISRPLSHGGSAHLLLRMSKTARDALRRDGRLRVSVSVSFGGLRRSETVTLKLSRRNG
jgi:hypothetical protein